MEYTNDQIWQKLATGDLNQAEKACLAAELKRQGGLTPADLWAFLCGRHVADDVRLAIGREMDRERSFVARILDDIDTRSGSLVGEAVATHAIGRDVGDGDDEKSPLQQLLLMIQRHQ